MASCSHLTSSPILASADEWERLEGSMAVSDESLKAHGLSAVFGSGGGSGDNLSSSRHSASSTHIGPWETPPPATATDVNNVAFAAKPAAVAHVAAVPNGNDGLPRDRHLLQSHSTALAAAGEYAQETLQREAFEASLLAQVTELRADLLREQCAREVGQDELRRLSAQLREDLDGLRAAGRAPEPQPLAMPPQTEADRRTSLRAELRAESDSLLVAFEGKLQQMVGSLCEKVADMELCSMRTMERLTEIQTDCLQRSTSEVNQVWHAVHELQAQLRAASALGTAGAASAGGGAFAAACVSAASATLTSPCSDVFAGGELWLPAAETAAIATVADAPSTPASARLEAATARLASAMASARGVSSARGERASIRDIPPVTGLLGGAAGDVTATTDAAAAAVAGRRTVVLTAVSGAVSPGSPSPLRQRAGSTHLPIHALCTNGGAATSAASAATDGPPPWRAPSRQRRAPPERSASLPPIRSVRRCASPSSAVAAVAAAPMLVATPAALVPPPLAGGGVAGGAFAAVAAPVRSPPPPSSNRRPSSARRTSTAWYPPPKADLAHMSMITPRVWTASFGQRTATAPGSPLLAMTEPAQTAAASAAEELQSAVAARAVVGAPSVGPQPRSATLS